MSHCLHDKVHDAARIDGLCLARFALFDGVAAHALTELACRATRQTYARGALIRACDAGRHDIVVIAQGLAALYRLARDG